VFWVKPATQRTGRVAVLSVRCSRCGLRHVKGLGEDPENAFRVNLVSGRAEKQTKQFRPCISDGESRQNARGVTKGRLRTTTKDDEFGNLVLIRTYENSRSFNKHARATLHDDIARCSPSLHSSLKSSLPMGALEHRA
jgi:hypothetical protein